MQILNCDNLISSCCQDYGLARILSTASNIIDLIHIIVPIILILMATITLFQIMANPDEKKLKNKLRNSVIATVIIFFIPTFMSAVLNILPNNFSIKSCLKASKNIASISRNNTAISNKNKEEEKERVSIFTNPDRYEKGKEKKEKKWNFIFGDTSNDSNDSNSNSNDDSNNSSSNISQSSSSNGKGPILLIAGHSYPNYCSQYSDCRGKTVSGYAEEDETRKLVKLIKKNLDNLGVKNDIANALLAGNYDQMNKSFFIESRNNSEIFRKYNWNNYSFVLEVHFNATQSHTGKGTLLCKKNKSYSTKADNDIVNAITKHTGHSRLADSIQGLNNVSFFMNRNIPITYLETEFYDNASAMKPYSDHINEIAYDIAVAIKKHYG